MSNNSGIQGNVNAGMIAINGNATNNGTITLNVTTQLREHVDELEKHVGALPLDANTREAVGEPLADLKEAVAQPQPEPKKVEKALDRTIKVLKRAGVAASALMSLTNPVTAIAELIGASVSAFL